MKKILALLLGAALGTALMIGPAHADNGADPSADNKQITFCHATGSTTNPYNMITTSVSVWYSGHSGHADDIWPAFSYTDKGGDVVNVPAQGDTSLLAFPDCQAPVKDVPIPKPDYVYNDACGTKDDTFAVAPGTGYIVSGPAENGDGTQSITLTLAQGFVWADGSHDPVVYTQPDFTNVDCRLPDTGSPAQHATVYGIGAVALIGLLGTGLVVGTRRRNQG